MTLLVTGATGFLGSYVTARALARGEDVVCLVRGEDPQARLDAALEPLGAAGARAIAGDMDGDAPLRGDLAGVRAVVHCAASVSFTLPLERARAINVEGTRRVLELARSAPGLERFVHVSTAYVAGAHDGEFTEADLDLGQRFRNTYEQTKHEAEHHVRASGLPWRIVRPSIVVGESATGWTSSFNVLYPPLHALARGLVTRVPAEPGAIVDVVGVDHVAEVVETALTAPECSQVLHAVAAEHALRAQDLAELAAEHLERPVPVLDPAATELPPGGLDVYAPYFTVRTRYEAAGARALGLEPEPLGDFLPRILDFARAARWGKRPLPRPLSVGA